MVGRKNKQKSMRAREFIHNLATAPRQDIARVMAVMGRDADGDQVGSPLTLDQVAILESRFTGNAPVSKEAIRATLLKYGIDAPMVNMLIGTDLTSLDGAELTNGEASLAAAGYRSDTSLTKLTNDGFGNEGSSMGAARPGEAAPRLSAADRKALDVLGKNTVKQNKLERDNAAVDEFLAPPKQEAPEVVANRLATAEKTKLAPAPRIAQVNGELEEVEIDEQVQKERALEAEIKAAQIAWNSNLDAGDVAFEDMPSRLQLEVLRLERAVDEGTMTARQRRELQFELQERANEQRTDTPGIQGPDAGAQAPRSGQVRIGNDTDQTGTGVDLAPAEQPERAGVPEPTLDTGNATSQRESAADTDITDAPDKNERRARVQDAYEQAEIDADQEFELATAYDADPGSDAFLDRLSEDLSKPSAELPKPIRKAVARIAKLAPPAPVAAIGDDSRTIDGTGLIREVSEAEMELVTGALSNRPGELALLESTYGAKSGTDEFIAKLREDVVRFANGMVTKIDAAIRGIIRGIANGVLAVGLVFNPGAFTKGLDINLPRTVSVWTTAQTQIEVTPTVTVPANAEAKMSPLARQVYTSMAPAAAKTGKGFMIADKPMGMLHVFKPDGSLLVQDAALYGKDSGDAVTGLGSLSGGAKITPAGQYTLKTTLDPEYAGGMRIDLAETLGGGQVIAVHAAWMGDAAENRGARLKSPTASDNKISYGCINTSHDMFLKSVMPNAAMLEGGLIFVMPDATQNTSAMFPQQTETRTSETTSVADSQQRDSGARADTSRTVMGKEEKAQFSQGTQSRGSTAQQVTAEVQGMMATSARLVVVDKLTDLPAAVQDAVSKQSTNGKAVRGFVLNGRGYLVAGNITPGTARSVFMHEVGVHLGLDKILSPALHRQLADKLRAWAALGNNSQESRIAQAAMARVEQAGTDAADQNSELIAYFVEEAMNAGIDPTAMQHKGEMARWFRSLWAAFKSAMRKLGINADKLTAQDVVDMAYGAAKLEMSGAWHGTAGSFRKFDHKFMGSGEGAQAFGWGSYFAQRRGIAKGYFATDVANKGISVDLQRQRDAELSRLALDLKVAQDAVADPNTPSELAELMKATIPELARKLSDRQAHWAKFNDAPDGALMRVDFSVADDEWLDLDKPMSEQSEKVQAAIKDSGHGWMDKTTTGRQFYDQVSREQAPYDEDGEQAPGTSNDKAASEYLDSIGIKGNKFLDANSRGGEENKMSNLVVFNDKNIQRVASLVGADAGRVKFSVGPQAQAEQRLAETGKAVGSTLTRWMQNVGNVASFTEDLVRRAVDAGMRSAKAYEVAQAARGAQVRAHERKVHDVLEKFSNLPYAAQQAANKVLYDSTRESKWGYAPPWDPKAVVDPVMAARLQALGKDSPAAVTFIKAVFQHGHDTLIDKKKSAMDHVETEYAALIEDVKMDPEAVALLQKEKKRLLERFTSLFAVQGKGPYAPLRRDGNFLVLAKSKAFVAAELNADNAAIERMMRDPNHYMVSMAKTEVEGQALANALRATGKYDTAPESVLSRPKEAALQDLYGGNSMMGAFLKLKSRIEVERGEASREEAGTLRRMNQMVTQMYLESLSEGSARKSEMRRIGVAAQNMDMVAGFAAQGVADAQFMATVAHGGDILKSIGAMRKEWKGPGGTAEQTAKGKLFNEIVARHVQSMDFKPTPLADGLTRASSIWMLATSPAYYLANLTQTWLISLPYMTKQHDYTAAAGAIFKAYGDVKNLLGTAKVFSSLDFSKVPEADRKAVRALLDMGVIDAGLDTDTGSIKLERSGPVAAGWNKVDNSLRIISQKVEAVNRLSAGLAAYRLELARTQSHEAAVEYARNVITQTHGDYTRGNAPRVFNTAAGKVALQFRKFQLIQIGLIGSLAKQAFAGATPAEKAVARRALGFMFAHLGAVGGAIALPGYALIGSLAAGLLGGDGPDDADEMLRRAIGDKHISDLLLNGLPGLVGAGIGDRVGFGKILSPLPFSKAPVDRTSFKEITYDAITGPFGGLALKGVSGLQMMAKGDYMKGLEYLLPNGLGNMLKAGRYATEGVTNTKGELLMNADEIRGVDTFLQGLGITPLAQSRRMELQNAKYEVDAYFNAQSASIRKAYLEGDRAEAMQAWREMNEVRVARGYRIAPMSDLLRAPREAAKRAKMVAGGVQFDRSNKGFVVGRSEE